MSIKAVILTGHENFFLWQDNVEDCLVQKGLWGLITGDTTTPELRTPDQIEPPPLPAEPSTETEEQQLACLTAHQQAAEATLAAAYLRICVQFETEFHCDKKEYDAQVQKANGIVKLSLDSSLCSIVTKNTPKEIYDEIIGHFQKNDACQNIKAIKELISL